MQTGEKRKLVILTGPTAVGKTALSIGLAREIGAEIISADSMQVYRHMDIGSAKIRQEEMQGVKHHLVDVLSPTEHFDVARFQALAKEAMEQIYANGHIPLIVGGTGFYIQSILYDIDFHEDGDENSEIRKRLMQIYREQGAHALHERLAEIDPQSAENIHENNVKRVIRAIEFFELTGQRISEHNEQEHQKEPAYDFCYFVLNDDRQKLYRKIEQRVDEMVEEGLVQEVQGLLDMGCEKQSTAMQGLGYKEIIDYLCGECTLKEAVYRIKRDTRHFAKRQLTWFRREKYVTWIDKQAFSYEDAAILGFMCECLRKNHVIERGYA